MAIRRRQELRPKHRHQLNLERKPLIFNEQNKQLPPLMAALSYLQPSRWAKTRRNPAMAGVAVLQGLGENESAAVLATAAGSSGEQGGYQNDPTCRELTKHWLRIPRRDRTIKYGGGAQIRPLELYIFVIDVEKGLFPPKPSIFFFHFFLCVKTLGNLRSSFPSCHCFSAPQHAIIPLYDRRCSCTTRETTQLLYGEWTHW